MSTQANPPHYPNDPQFNPQPQSGEAAYSRSHRPAAGQPIPEFLQRHHQEQAPPRPRVPRDTVVPVLNDETMMEESPGLSPVELEELERQIASVQPQPQPRLRRSLSPDFVPPPPLRPKAKIGNGGMGGLMIRLGLVAAVIVFAALLLTGKIPLPAGWKSAAAAPWQHFASLVRSAPTVPAPQPAPQPASLPKLVVEGADAGNSDEIGLGVKIAGRVEGVTALVSGLAPGSKLTRGQPSGIAEWIVPAAELAETKLHPPADFSGVMQYTVALRMPDSKIADRQTLRLQWSQLDREPKRKLQSDEIATMVSRGQTLFENGDIAGARLLLQRAAEAGDQTAAMAMAATYDPGVMQNLGVRGVEADVEKARYWYRKASEYGSREAPKRLESLASQSR